MLKTILYFLAAVALLLGNVLAYNSAPLSTFHLEWCYGVGWIFLTAAFFADGKLVDKSLHSKTWIVLILPLSLAIAAYADYIFGRNEYPSTAVLYCIYLGMLTAALWLGIQVAAQSTSEFSKRFWVVFAAVLLVAALINGFAAFIQLLKIDVPNWLIVAPNKVARMYGNVRQPNLFSTLLTLGVIALMGLSFGTTTSRVNTRTLAFLGLAVFLGAASSLSASRTGLLLTIVVSVAAWVGNGLPKLSRLIATAAAASNIAGWFLLSKLSAVGEVSYSGLQRLDISAGADFSSRRDDLWQAMLQLVRENPLFGSGFNRLNYDYFLLDTPHRLALNLQNAHNIPLQIAVEHGVPFALAWLGVLCFVLWAARKTWSLPIARLCWIALIALGIHSSLEYPLWYLYFLLPAGLALGAIVGFASKMDQRNTESAATTTAPVKVGLVGVSAVVALVAALGLFRDYQKIQPVFRAASPDEVMTLLERGYTTRLFTPWMDYAVVANTPVTPDNAKLYNRVAKRLSTFTLTNFLVMNLALSSAMIGKHEDAVFYLKRLKEIYGENFTAYLGQLTPAELAELKPALASMNLNK